MTEQEAKEILSLSPEEKVELPNLSEVYEIAVQALEDIQKYRTIGTVEECRTAREKQIPMKAKYENREIIRHRHNPKGKPEWEKLIKAEYLCSNCKSPVGEDNYCSYCGQAIDWRKSDEGGNDDDKDSDESDNQVRTYRHPLADTGTYIL